VERSGMQESHIVILAEREMRWEEEGRRRSWAKEEDIRLGEIERERERDKWKKKKGIPE
jgi:hypothetical protein